ncbi:hypothetical protein RchiOBHm_Chr5g0063181 [Rosa chinensis]|uniref:Uncharacterized protein n=1 Tax=Rosa chinensis TaxID=74649 RepID=A0A2P6QID0_ROSCH|nr:hypothetical protein RchiOBHm_Chr5g0063181 [Rosa chinensis]
MPRRKGKFLEREGPPSLYKFSQISHHFESLTITSVSTTTTTTTTFYLHLHFIHPALFLTRSALFLHFPPLSLPSTPFKISIYPSPAAAIMSVTMTG